MRILSVRFLALCFFILGLWNIFLFIQRISTDGFINLAYILPAAILLNTGGWLFSFKEIGRKFALAILAIDILRVIIVSFLMLSQKEFAVYWVFLGASAKIESVPLFVAIATAYILIEILFGLLLFQEKTRWIFQNRVYEFL